MRSRGFTLIEVMVGAAVALVVIAVVTGSFLAQQKALQALDLAREASNASRDAMLSIQESLGRAGYGIDPRYTFDFSWYGCPNYTATSFCRDSVQNPDEIVFVSRDPNYYWAGTATSTIQGCDTTALCSGHAWRVTAFDSSSVTIAANAGDTFRKGQLVEMTCAQGRSPLIGTVSSYDSGSGKITLDTTSSTNPYKQVLGSGHPSCFDQAGVSLFLVNRYRYHIVTLNGDPWLMLDRGIDYNGNGATPEPGSAGGPDLADEIPIAHGVEGMQIAYVLNSSTSFAAPDNGSDWIIGNTVGTREEADPSATAPTQDTATTDPSRFNKNPANIRAVRVSITVRSLRQDITQPSTWIGDEPTPNSVGYVENRNDFTAVMRNRYRRYFSSVSIAIPNMTSKDPFLF